MSMIRVGAGLLGFVVLGVWAGVSQSADLEIMTDGPASIALPSSEQCPHRTPPLIPDPFATIHYDWCDPGNKNLLQMDRFGKSGGKKGAYKYSIVNIPCNSGLMTEKAQKLCP